MLKISYDALDEQEKCIFLDFACLFVKMNMKREDAIDILKGCGFEGEIAIADLTAKSLMKVYEDGMLWMHDQVRDMGRQIVRHESDVYPGMRSRLWDRDEILNVFKDDKVQNPLLFTYSCDTISRLDDNWLYISSLVSYIFFDTLTTGNKMYTRDSLRLRIIDKDGAGSKW